MVGHHHPSSPTPRPQGVVQALASSPPIARRRRLNSGSSGVVTGVAGWRRAPVSDGGGRRSTLGMGMQSTPAKRSKSIDTIPWHPSASKKTKRSSVSSEEVRSGDSGSQSRLNSDTPQGGSEQNQSMTQWQDPLESTSERDEIYQDLEVPMKFGTSSWTTTPEALLTGGNVGEDPMRTPRPPIGSPSVPPSRNSTISHYDITAPLNDEDERTPTSAGRRASSKIASRPPTPRPKLSLPPSDPPWSSTPSVLRDEHLNSDHGRSSSSPEIPRQRYSSGPPWESLGRSSPPSPLRFGLLGDVPALDLDFPSSIQSTQRQLVYNPGREERALQPDPFGFHHLHTIVEGRTPQVFCPSSQDDDDRFTRAHTPARSPSPASSAERSPVSPEVAVSVRQSTPSVPRHSSPVPSPRKKRQYWLGRKMYRRMENGASDSDDSEEALPVGKRRPKTRKRKAAPKKATPEPDQAALDARAARIAHFEELDKHYNLTVEYVWS